MIRNIFHRFFRGANKFEQPEELNQHVVCAEAPSLVYAVGDVHGCLDELLAIERKIVSDSQAIPGEKLIVMLGDYVDRGPNSAGVIEHLISEPPEEFKRICLLGNHEVMAREFFARPHRSADWLGFGGIETLMSYGISSDMLQGTKPSHWSMLTSSHVPDDHLEFLGSLPWTLRMPGWLFVHAGIRPGVPIHTQLPSDLLWIRESFYEAADLSDPIASDFRVVHGHTPATAPVITPGRICIDTGAYATGRLSAVRITPDGRYHLLQTTPSRDPG